MKAAKAKAYRGLAALGNFMAQDRADIGLATKEVSKTMAAPAECDLQAMKRLGRYLAEHPSCVNLMRWQESPTSIDCYSDSDWGGDLTSRRSFSGGCIFHGRHLVQHWARTQQVVSLSSAEAELHGLTKAASEGLAVSNMSMELFISLPLRSLTDSSAARGIILRSGVGRAKHLDIKLLWIQERDVQGDLQCIKIPRLQNCSDLLTHHFTEAEGKLHLENMGLVVRSVRHQPTPARGGHEIWAS